MTPPRRKPDGSAPEAEGLSPSAVRALADPTRLRILELLSQQPRTVAELADELDGIGRTSIYYHVNVLERDELVRVVEKRAGHRRPEMVYGAIDHGVVSRRGRSRGASNVVLAALDVVREELTLRGRDDDDEDARATVGKETLWLTDADLDRLQGDLSALLAKYRRLGAPPKDRRGRAPYSLLAAIYRSRR